MDDFKSVEQRRHGMNDIIALIRGLLGSISLQILVSDAEMQPSGCDTLNSGCY